MLNIYRKLINIVIILVIGILPVFSFIQPVSAATAWYNSAWLYRKAFTVTGSSAGSQVNYPLKINVMYGNGTDLTGLNQEPSTGTYAMDAGSGATTIVDTQFTSAVDSYYVGCTYYNVTRSLGGTITAYVGASKTATTSNVAGQTNGDTYYIISRVPTIYLDSKAQVDFDDIRFSKADGITLLDAWLESKTDSSTATVWVEVDTIIATNSFYIYYGNPIATPNWNGTNTFTTFDDFERGVNGDALGGGWTATGATISTDWNYTALTSTGVAGTRSAKIAGSVAANNNMWATKTTGSNNYAISTRIYKETASNFGASGHGGATNSIQWQITAAELLQNYIVGWTTAATITADAWQKLAFTNINFGTPSYDLWLNDVLVANDVGMRVAAVFTNQVYFLDGNSGVGNDEYLDNYIVRNYCLPEPLITAWATIEVAPTPVVIQDVKVFQSYKTTNDWLIAIRYIDIYAPYFDTFDIKQYFAFQLTDSVGTVIAQTIVPMWGNKVGNIYLSPTLAGSLTYGGVYYIKMYGLFTGNPVTSYLLQSGDWQGDDLAKLDSWVLSSASVLAAYYTPTMFTIYIAGKGEVLNSTGGAIFDTGINGLSTVRPSIFQTYSVSTVATPSTFTQPYRTAVSAWQTNIGPDGTVMLTRLGNLLGVPGNLIATFLFVCMMIILAMIAFPAGATLAANILSIPMLFAGVYFGLDLIYILLLSLFAAFLLAKKLFMDTGM